MRRPHPRRLTVRSLLAAALAAAALPARAQPDVPLENEVRPWVNFEPPVLDPIALSADGARVYVLDVPGDRLEIRLAPDLSLLRSVPVGLSPTAVAPRPGSKKEVWVVNHLSDSVSVVNWKLGVVVRTIRVPDEPVGIVFTPDGRKAYVSCAQPSLVQPIDCATYRPIGGGIAIPAEDPAAIGISPSGDTVWVASRQSGNQTALLEGAIRKLPYKGFSRPDEDVFGIDVATDALVPALTKSGVGTTLLGLAVRGDTGEVLVANTDARNGDFFGETGFPLGQVAFNRLSLMGPLPGDAVTAIDLDGPAPAPDTSFGLPTDIALDGTTRLAYVAAYGAAAIAVVDEFGAIVHRLETSPGPRGLALDAAARRLYCYCRVGNEVQVFDLSGAPQSALFPAASAALAPSSEPADVIAGRAFAIDTKNSGGGTSSCFTCHMDGDKDMLAWDLGKLPFKDAKGPRVTQSLRGIGDTFRMHWRGEQEDLEAFNPAFENLLHGEALAPGDFAKMKSFMLSIFYPPNPHQPFDRSLSPAAERGAVAFIEKKSLSDAFSCADCHAGPHGDNGEIMFAPPMHKPTELRGLFKKESPEIATGIPEDPSVAALGYGFLHDGIVDSLRDFMDIFVLTEAEKDDVTAFCREFDSGIAPSVGYHETLTIFSLASSRLDEIVAEADKGNCDVAGHGIIKIGRARTYLGLYYDGSVFRTDKAGEFYTQAELEALAAARRGGFGLMAVPRGSGRRLGIDRDEDALLDRDEIAAGTSPVDPDSDDDGFPDGHEAAHGGDPLDPGAGSSDGAAPAFLVPPTVAWSQVEIVKLQFSTNEPTRYEIEYGPTMAYGTTASDPALRRDHTVLLRGLRQDTTYHYVVRVFDAQGNSRSSGENLLATDDTLFDAVHVRELELEVDVTSQPGTAIVTGTVRLLDQDDRPTPGLVVDAIWWRDGFFVGLPFETVDPATGVATFTLATPHDPGAEIEIQIPPFLGWQGEPTFPLIGTTNLATGAFGATFYAFPLNESDCVKVTLP